MAAARAAARVVARDWRPWLLLVGLFGATLAAYHPAWHGGMVWDDDGHVTAPVLRSWTGLYRIWFDVRATLQYYPLLHTAFWVEHRLWGDTTLWYHLVNILEHAGVALMLALVLRRLKVPGAWLATAVFALHPVHVESVAWISEQKNTLSTLFYLAAAMLYLRFDESRKTRWYAAALAAFVLALLSKTVTATLPGGLLVLFWWQRGRLSWKRDVLPLAPFFIVGAGAATVTAWWELDVNNCVGPAFQFTMVERVLIAGRGIWFHLGKLFWPTGLAFIYPRWTLDTHAWWQYLFPAGVGLLAAVAWAVRRFSRAPLAALLFFCGTLFPVLGFFNLYTFRYSFVANHYQYLASAGIIALVSATLATCAARLNLRQASAGAVVVLLVPLALLTWNQSRQYKDAETLYRTTIALNPSCWLAHNNLAVLKLHTDVDDAIRHLDEALRIQPDDPEAHDNMGLALHRLGRYEEAAVQYREALRLRPQHAVAHGNYGTTLVAMGRKAEAIVQYEAALRIDPDNAEARTNLGNVLLDVGRVGEARAQYDLALNADPAFAPAHYNLATLLQRTGRFDQAAAEYEHALRLDPASSEARNNLGLTFERLGRPADAVAQYNEALRQQPDSAESHNNLGNALMSMGRLGEAIAHYREALRLRPDYPEAHTNLGTGLLETGQTEAALAEQREAVRLAPAYADAHYNLANTLDRMGRLEQAATAYAETLMLEPDSADVLAALGSVLDRLGRPQKAAELYAQAVRLEPTRAEIHNDYGFVLQESGRLQEASAQYAEAIRLNPALADAHNNLGNIFRQAGRLDEALGQYQETVRLRPDSAVAQNNLGLTLERLGRAEEAAARYEEAARLGLAEARANAARLANAFK